MKLGMARFTQGMTGLALVSVVGSWLSARWAAAPRRRSRTRCRRAHCVTARTPRFRPRRARVKARSRQSQGRSSPRARPDRDRGVLGGACEGGRRRPHPRSRHRGPDQPDRPGRRSERRGPREARPDQAAARQHRIPAQGRPGRVDGPSEEVRRKGLPGPDGPDLQRHDRPGAPLPRLLRADGPGRRRARRREEQHTPDGRQGAPISATSRPETKKCPTPQGSAESPRRGSWTTTRPTRVCCQSRSPPPPGADAAELARARCSPPWARSSCTAGS